MCGAVVPAGTLLAAQPRSGAPCANVAPLSACLLSQAHAMSRWSSLSCLLALLPELLLPAPLPGSPPSVLIAERSVGASRRVNSEVGRTGC